MYGSSLYGMKLGERLSRFLDRDEWAGSPLEKMHAESEGNVHVRRVPAIPRRLELPKYAWYLADMYWSDEDSTNTIFRLFWPDESPAPTAIGIHWDTYHNSISKPGDFIYPNEFGGRYYPVVGNKFHTVETGGYTAQVLDYNYPSEGLSFGLKVDHGKHQCLVVSFQLLEFDF